eukprot:5572201-Lingulodinium_polyedra.AAC.1
MDFGSGRIDFDSRRIHECDTDVRRRPPTNGTKPYGLGERKYAPQARGREGCAGLVGPGFEEGAA